MGPQPAPDPHSCPAGPPFPSLSHQHLGRDARGRRRRGDRGAEAESRGEAAPSRTSLSAESGPGCDRQRPPCPVPRRLPVVYGPATPLQESGHHQLSEQEPGSPLCLKTAAFRRIKRRARRLLSVPGARDFIQLRRSLAPAARRQTGPLARRLEPGYREGDEGEEGLVGGQPPRRVTRRVGQGITSAHPAGEGAASSGTGTLVPELLQGSPVAHVWQDVVCGFLWAFAPCRCASAPPFRHPRASLTSRQTPPGPPGLSRP